MKRFIYLITIALLLFSCKAKQNIVTDIQYRDRTVHDSIYFAQKESVYVDRKGDTVFVTRLKSEVKYKLQQKTDSVYLNKYITRTVTRTKTNTKTKEIPVRGFVWWLGLAFFLYIILKIIIKLNPNLQLWQKLTKGLKN